MTPRFLLPCLTALGALPLFGCDSAETQCTPGVVATGCPSKTKIRATTIGSTPDAGKRATYAGPAADFTIKSADDDSPVFGPFAAGDAIESVDTGENVHIVDFTDLRAPGDYYVDVKGVGRSARFSIADDVFAEPFVGAMLGMHGLRCGSAVQFAWHGTTFSHGECHLGDDAPGGWHDAGDYGKYTNNGSLSLGMMLLAWEHFREKIEPLALPIPEAGGDLPDFLDECKYQIDWLLGMQDADTGGVYDRLTPYCSSCDAGNQPFDPLTTMPEASTNDRRLAPISTTSTADFAAVIARSARVFEEFDAEYATTLKEAAQRAWQYLVDNPANVSPVNLHFTGGYVSDDPDDRLWAAAEIWETTGDEGALAKFEAAFDDPALKQKVQFASNWDWPSLQNLGIFTYLGSTREGRSTERVDALTDSLISTADSMRDASERHAHGRSLDRLYYWGINGVLARTAITFEVAARTTGDDTYRVASAYQLDHLFGRNYYARSFVTGLGQEPPQSPHHRPSIGDGVSAPWPGLLIGGPSNRTTPLIATTWKDESGDYESNEVAINWNAALVYLLAQFLPPAAE
jgi:endoglucanase